MRVLVTGGAGFLGSHTCLALLEKNHEIVIIDSFINSHRKSLEKVEQIMILNNNKKKFEIKIHVGDIRDEKLLDDLFINSKKQGKPIESVIHFGALKSINESISKPLEYWDVNVNGSINLFKVMMKHSCKKIIFSSSASIYDACDSKLITEKHRIKPSNPYSQTKYTIETILNNIFDSDSDEWRIVILRYFNPIGAHHSGLIGEAPNGIPNNIFPIINKVANGKLDQLSIFGKDWHTLDGTGVRDFIHVMDIAEGHLSALEFISDNKPQITNINLGTGEGTSVLQLINTFETVNKVKIPYNFSKRREGDLGHVVADNSLAISLLDWKPMRSLEDMCADGWKWQKLNPNGYL